ncbi:MAG: hypothetical protein H0Z19_05290 [Archaeoglobus sp.]|uniref:hypothetical protein n=1 Tax=Archaeoglobus sp. TaxID=1872626 RepID=UPI001D4844A2|nr:hypothetical protein [Archaeoglobus sp.]MBO8179882.1 hypothetical protein [Archaeoglobus sp.]
MLVELFILHYGIAITLLILSWLRVSETSAVFAVISMILFLLLARNAGVIEVLDSSGTVQSFSDITTMYVSVALAVLQLVRFVVCATSAPIRVARGEAHG